jgi:membrane dipeptidase
MSENIPGPLFNLPLGVIDMHMHPTLKTFMLGKNFLKRHHPPGFMFPLTMRTDLDALIAGGVKAFFSVVYMVEQDFLEDVWPLRYIRWVMPRVKHIFREAPDKLVLECLEHQEAIFEKANASRGPIIETALSFSDFQRIMAEGKIAVLRSIEGAHHLNGNLDNIETFYERGVCHMIVPHLYPNEACENVNAFPDLKPLRKIGCFTKQANLDSGLTPFGCDVVDKMLDLGMIVDMCHGTPRCRAEILERARNHAKKRPIVMSHVGVHELAPHPMNPTPQEIHDIAETGGVIGIIAMSHWLKQPEQRDGLAVMLETVEYLIKHGSDDVVAFGSDFDGFTGPPRDFKSPRDYETMRQLLRIRYGEERAAKFLSGNVERVLQLGWGKQ